LTFEKIPVGNRYQHILNTAKPEQIPRQVTTLFRQTQTAYEQRKSDLVGQHGQYEARMQKRVEFEDTLRRIVKAMMQGRRIVLKAGMECKGCMVEIESNEQWLQANISHIKQAIEEFDQQVRQVNQVLQKANQPKLLAFDEVVSHVNQVEQQEERQQQPDHHQQQQGNTSTNTSADPSNDRRPRKQQKKHHVPSQTRTQGGIPSVEMQDFIAQTHREILGDMEIRLAEYEERRTNTANSQFLMPSTKKRNYGQMSSMGNDNEDDDY